MSARWAERLADRLGVDAEQLMYLVDQHHDPEADAILEWADAGEQHREAVKEALTEYERRKARDRAIREERINGGGA